MNYLKNAILKGKFNVTRLFPSYLICFAPFFIFGTRNDIDLILWKVAVTGTGLVVFHFVRKSMFPYIDIAASIKAVHDAPSASRLPMAIVFLAQALLISAMAVAILYSIAGGM